VTAPDPTFVDRAAPFVTAEPAPAPPEAPPVPEVSSSAFGPSDLADSPTTFVRDEAVAPDLNAPPVDVVAAVAPDLTAAPGVAALSFEPTVDTADTASGPETARAESLFTAEPDLSYDEMDESRPVTSAASMATEILSAAPEVPVAAPAEQANVSEIISKDLTLIARGRKKRFRLR